MSELNVNGQLAVLFNRHAYADSIFKYLKLCLIFERPTSHAVHEVTSSKRFSSHRRIFYELRAE